MDTSSKKFRIILSLGIVLCVSLVLFAVFFARNKPSPQGVSQQTSEQTTENRPLTTLPARQLPPDEEVKVRRFVKLFVDLYNTYSDINIKSALNEATFGTPAFQAKAIEHFDTIEQSILPNSWVVTDTDEATFTYQLSQINTLVTTIAGTVKEKHDEQTISYPVLAEVKLVLVNNSWVVEDITITKSRQ